MATIASAFLGFLGGTLVNHLLSQRRADRERADRHVDICQGLIGEIQMMDKTTATVELWPPTAAADPTTWGFYVSMALEPDQSFYETVKGELGFLGSRICLEIHSLYREGRMLGRLLGKHVDREDQLRVTGELKATLAEFRKNCSLNEDALLRAQRMRMRRSERLRMDREMREVHRTEVLRAFPKPFL